MSSNIKKERQCLFNLYLQYESAGSPPPLNQLRSAAADVGLVVVTHAVISNGCHGTVPSPVFACKMSSQMDVVLAKATEGITPNLTSGDLGGDVEGGERDLCGEAKNTGDAQNPSSFSRLKV